MLGIAHVGITAELGDIHGQPLSLQLAGDRSLRLQGAAVEVLVRVF